MPEHIPAALVACHAALNIAGVHYPCEDTGGLDHSIHRNQAARAIWASHDEIEGSQAVTRCPTCVMSLRQDNDGDLFCPCCGWDPVRDAGPIPCEAHPAQAALLAPRQPSEVRKAANISDDGLYRYTLARFWAAGPAMVFVMLNPSTADAFADDPTIRRCIGFARREGMAGVGVVNLYAYRSTDPKALLTCADPVGPQNDGILLDVLSRCQRAGGVVVAAWGANGQRERIEQVLTLVPGVDWRCLGTTKSGQPRHPLYVKGDQPLVPYRRLLLGSAKASSVETAPTTPVVGDPQ